MNTMLIAAVVIIAIAAVAGYMYMSGDLGYTAPASSTGPTDSPAAGTTDGNIDEASSTSAATDAEAAVTEAVGDLSSADNIDIPDVQ